MENLKIILLFWLFWLYLLFIVFYFVIIKIYHNKIDAYQKKIKSLFTQRNNMIPTLFEVTKPYLENHNIVFRSILENRRIEILSNSFIDEWEYLLLEAKIHKDLDFIFKLASKSPKLLKSGNFLYLRDDIINKSSEIWKSIDIYRMIIKKYNKLIKFKSLTIIWIFLNTKEKDSLL